MAFHLSRTLHPYAKTVSKLGYPVTIHGHSSGSNTEGSSIFEILDLHFSSDLANHICKNTFVTALSALDEKPAVIVETGSSAWGSNSSQLFDRYVHEFGGEFFTVDVRMQPMLQLRKILGPASTAVCDDSVRFLHRWYQEHGAKSVDFVYLDSWDLELIDPLPAAIHGLREFLAVRPCLRDGSIVLIDDTPLDLSYFKKDDVDLARDFILQTGMLPGKGSLVLKLLADDPKFEVLSHEYQIVYRYHEE